MHDDQHVKENYASNDLWISHLFVTQMDRSHFILYMESLTTVYVAVITCSYLIWNISTIQSGLKISEDTF